MFVFINLFSKYIILFFYLLYLLLALFETFLEILLEHMSFLNSLFVLIIFEKKLLEHCITETELIYTVLERFFSHDIAYANCAHTLNGELSLRGHVHNFFHSDDFVFAEQEKCCLFGLVSRDELLLNFADGTA